MFVQRALITFTVGPLALYLIVLGGWFYFLPITAVLLLGVYEYAHMIQKIGWQMPIWLLLPIVLIFSIDGQWPHRHIGSLIMVGSLLIVMAYALWLYEKRLSNTVPADWLAMMGAIVLLGWLASHFFRLRGLADMAWQWTMLAMVTTWMADSAAYVVGKFLTNNVFGRHHLSPRLSPNKTIEGYVGGILFGTSISILLASWINLPLWPAFILGLLITIISPLGDLAISLLKREAGVKDSGVLFPGHGGALDRIDSLVWSVTIAYYLVLFINS